jgi:hypothetical protein
MNIQWAGKRAEMPPPARRRLRVYILSCLLTLAALPALWMLTHSPREVPLVFGKSVGVGDEASDAAADHALDVQSGDARGFSTQPLPLEDDDLAPSASSSASASASASSSSSSSSASSLRPPTARFLVSYVYYEHAHQSACERDNKRTNLAMFLAFAVAASDPSVVHFAFTFSGQGRTGHGARSHSSLSHFI